MLGIIFAIFSSLTQGVKKLLHRSVLANEDSLSYAFVYQTLSALLLVPFLFFDFKIPNVMSWHILLVLFSAILWTLIAYFGFKSYSRLDVSIKTIFGESKVLFTFILSIIILREVVTLTKFLGVFLVFVGILIISHKKGEKWGHLKDKGVIYSLIASFLTAVVVIVDKYAQTYYSTTTYSFLVYLLPAIFFIPFVISKGKEVKSIMKNSFWQILVAAVLSTVSYYLMLKAFTLADASIVYTITRASILITIIGGIIFLKEKEDMLKRLLVGVIILAGVLLLIF
jgi:glucose uptake protein